MDDELKKLQAAIEFFSGMKYHARKEVSEYCITAINSMKKDKLRILKERAGNNG